MWDKKQLGLPSFGESSYRICDSWEMAFMLAKQRSGVITRKDGKWIFHPDSNHPYDIFFDDEQQYLKRKVFGSSCLGIPSDEKLRGNLWSYVEDDANIFLAYGLREDLLENGADSLLNDWNLDADIERDRQASLEEYKWKNPQ